jgi:hypothetical protein
MTDFAAQARHVNTCRIAYSMRALGKSELPDRLLVGQSRCNLSQTIKHDFFAATGLYRDASGAQFVLKMGRTANFFGIPLQWLGRFLRRRELHFYAKLADLPNVPRIMGKVGETGFVMEYIRGQPLSETSSVPDSFFDQLLALVREVHRRGIAYVDTNKPQNILLGEDAKPHLIDFQISWDSETLGRSWASRWLLRRLQADDLYHLTKHKRRLRPDELTDAEREHLARKSAFIRVHRFLTRPYFLVRRRLFRHLRETGRLLPEGSK